MDDDLLKEFLIESWENLSRLDNEIVMLEQDPDNEELLASIFRAVHTIKGTCGFLGLDHLGEVAHATETLLGLMRESILTADPDSISAVLEGVDGIKQLLRSIETSEACDLDVTTLVERLEVAASPEMARELAAVAAIEKAHFPSAVQETAPSRPMFPTDGEVERKSETGAAESLSGDASPKRPMLLPEGEGSSARVATDATKSAVDLSIRVSVEVLDRLMNLVGELVLTRNQMLQVARSEEDSRFTAAIAQLNRVTSDLQDGVMQSRMQPVGNAWSNLPRLVRDLSQQTGKQIALEMTGAETELDRTVLEAIRDPLIHMVRNSADHGIENVAARRAAGKPETGHIRLNAFHEGGQVVISIQDDGGGINRPKVLQKAIQQKLIQDSEARQLSDQEILRLLFVPGFSTADQITNVSGRGVGMDVVKTAIERIGGSVELSSVWGQGTTIRVRIPLTLAIISALVVETGTLTVAIPQLCVVELVRLTAEERSRVDRIGTREVFRLRDHLLPLVDLQERLGLCSERNEAADAYIVVVQAGQLRLGLVVTQVFDTEEIVVKPVGKLLRHLEVYQGTTILGDGRVIMILDVAGIARGFEDQSARLVEAQNAAANAEESAPLTSLLLFTSHGGDHLAVPLALVSRLEEFPRSRVERSGRNLVVQYRDELIPLLTIEGSPLPEPLPAVLPVIVFTETDRSMGLIVHEIQDIVEEPLNLQLDAPRPGVHGTAILAGRATDVIDMQHYLTRANPDWFRRRDTRKRLNVLAIDDSLFFRQLLKTAVEADGHRVHPVDSAVAAKSHLESSPNSYDAIICDVEMPVMDGCTFARWARSQPKLSQTPLIAITSLDDGQHGERVLGAGFNRMLMKFNPQQLSRTLQEVCPVPARRIGGSV